MSGCSARTVLCMGDPIFVRSADATRLRLVRAGEGKSIVLVHGTMGSKGDWFEVVRRLSANFAVTAFDRRGRGDSDEDVLAVIDASEPPVHLVGHSFGAIVSLLVAARASERIDKLVLYEPPLGVEEPAADEWLDQLDTMVATGELDAAIKSFASAANITDQELAMMERNDRVWAALRDAVRSAGREIRAAKSVLPIDEVALASIAAPTLVLLGSEQDHPSYDGVSGLADQLPRGTLGRVPGHHVALVFAPDEFVATVELFLSMES
jgi:pimeloyl-ACP methyl ester carboxylesterase